MEIEGKDLYQRKAQQKDRRDESDDEDDQWYQFSRGETIGSLTLWGSRTGG